MRGVCVRCKSQDELPLDLEIRGSLLEAPFLCRFCRLDDTKGIYGLINDGCYCHTGLLFQDVPGFIYLKSGKVVAVKDIYEFNKIVRAYTDHFAAQKTKSIKNPILKYVANLCIEADFQGKPYRGFLYIIDDEVEEDEQFVRVKYFDGDIEVLPLLDALLRIDFGSFKVVNQNSEQQKRFFREFRLIYLNEIAYIALVNNFDQELQPVGTEILPRHLKFVNIFNLKGKIVERVVVTSGFVLQKYVFSKPLPECKELAKYSDFAHNKNVLTVAYNHYFPNIMCGYEPGEHLCKFLKGYQVHIDIPVKQTEVERLYRKLKKKEKLGFILRQNKWFDPFCGNRSLSNNFNKALPKGAEIITNDIDKSKKAYFHVDALNYRNYNLHKIRNIRNVITSPPSQLLSYAIGLFIKIFDIIVVHCNSRSMKTALNESFLQTVTKHFEVYTARVTDVNSFLILVRGRNQSCEVVML